MDELLRLHMSPQLVKIKDKIVLLVALLQLAVALEVLTIQVQQQMPQQEMVKMVALVAVAAVIIYLLDKIQVLELLGKDMLVEEGITMVHRLEAVAVVELDK